MIKTERGILVEQQHLVFADQRLDDNKTLLEHKVGNDSTLHLNLLFVIFVHDVSSPSDLITIQAEPSDTIQVMKTKIEEILFTRHNNDVGLINTNFLKGKFYNPDISLHKRALDLILVLFQNEMRVFVDETNLDEENRNEIRVFTLEVDLWDTITNVYEKIEKKRGTGIDPWNEIVAKKMYAGEWPSCMGRGDGGVSYIYKKSSSDLSLISLRGMLIFIEPIMPKMISLRMSPRDTIAKTKAMLRAKVGYTESECGVLNFRGMNLEDELNLSDYNIREGSILILRSYCPVEDTSIQIRV